MTETTSISEALARFDRKERRLLVGTALGHETGLDQKFCDKIGELVRIIPLPAGDTRWFTDYHIDWLAGAVHVYARGEHSALEQVMLNEDRGEARLVCGNQQDVDLLLARDADIILIEAKWFGREDQEQFETKLKRLRLIREHADHVCREAKVKLIRMHVLLMSPVQPSEKMKAIWTAHNPGTDLRWLEMLPFGGQNDALTVERCDTNGYRKRTNSHWHLKKLIAPGVHTNRSRGGARLGKIAGSK
jgi:hypothetical protein